MTGWNTPVIEAIADRGFEALRNARDRSPRLQLNDDTINSSSSRRRSNIRGAALASASIRHWSAWNA
jgi:hypothetical protein